MRLRRILMAGCAAVLGIASLSIMPSVWADETADEIILDEEELVAAKEVELALEEYSEELGEFADAMEALRDEAMDFLSYGMPRQASFCLSFAGGSVSSLRLAVEELLGETGEGFSDWDTVGAINMATPMPFFCEEMTARAAGDTERADECLELAKLNPMQIDGMDDLDVILEMDEDELQKLREALIEFEEHIYWFYPAMPVNEERNGMEWSTDYHLFCAMAYEEFGDMQEALNSYMDALALDPFNTDFYILCAEAAMKLGDVNLMFTYIDEGLIVEPENGKLNLYAAILWYSVGDMELALEYAKAAEEQEMSDTMEAARDALIAELENIQEGDG